MVRRGRFFILPVIVVILIIAVIGWFIFRDATGPEIKLSSRAAIISNNSVLSIEASDVGSYVKSISVAIVNPDGSKQDFAMQTFPSNEKQANLEFKIPTQPRSTNSITLEVTATDGSLGNWGSGNQTRLQQTYEVDNLPPQARVTFSPYFVSQGNSALVTFHNNKELASATLDNGVDSFTCFPQVGNYYACLFALADTTDLDSFSPSLVLVDIADNVNRIPLSIRAKSTNFPSDTITLSDRFIKAKEAEFQVMVPNIEDPVERFLYINNQVRSQNKAFLHELKDTTSAAQLWKAGFSAIPRSAVRSKFADRRTYISDGVAVDYQTHMGLDYASVVRDKVPAANDGIIIFADYLGIYGNAVIIDHGLGLQTLYAHMSNIDVNVGDNVSKGDVLGNTGTSGMAWGDHLHFEFLVGGISVNPLEWLDNKWVSNLQEHLDNSAR